MEYVPEEQNEQKETDILDEYVPEKQSVQFEDPSRLLNFPAGHSEQNDAPASLNWPEVHFKQESGEL